MDDNIKLGVIGFEEITDIFATFDVNAGDVIAFLIQMLLEIGADKAFVACN